MNGEAATPTHGHVGWPVDWEDVLRRVRSGLPSYCPADPVLVDQAPYIAFASERGPNSE